MLFVTFALIATTTLPNITASIEWKFARRVEVVAVGFVPSSKDPVDELYFVGEPSKVYVEQRLYQGPSLGFVKNHVSVTDREFERSFDVRSNRGIVAPGLDERPMSGYFISPLWIESLSRWAETNQRVIHTETKAGKDEQVLKLWPGMAEITVVIDRANGTLESFSFPTRTGSQVFRYLDYAAVDSGDGLFPRRVEIVAVDGGVETPIKQYQVKSVRAIARDATIPDLVVPPNATIHNVIDDTITSPDGSIVPVATPPEKNRVVNYVVIVATVITLLIAGMIFRRIGRKKVAL